MKRIKLFKTTLYILLFQSYLIAQCFQIGDNKSHDNTSIGASDKAYVVDILNVEEWTYDRLKNKFKSGQIESYYGQSLGIKEGQTVSSNTSKTSSTISKNSDPNKFVLTFAGTEIIYNNHVGNEWFSYCKIDGKKVFYKEKVTVNMASNRSISIVSYLHETEEKYNDWASEEISMTKSELMKYRGSGFFVTVTIKESNGRYAGNTAQMKFYYYVD